MKKTQHQYKENRLRLWLVRLSLLFSVFAFSGYCGATSLQTPKVPQTELVLKQKDDASGYLLGASIISTCRTQFLILSRHRNYALLHENRRLSANFKAFEKQFLSYKQVVSRPSIRSLLPSSPEENYFAI